MQTGPTSAALGWARTGWRRVALVAASLVLAVALIASLGSSTSSTAVDTGAGDGTEQVVAAEWTRGGDDGTDRLFPVQQGFRFGPSWT